MGRLLLYRLDPLVERGAWRSAVGLGVVEIGEISGDIRPGMFCSPFMSGVSGGEISSGYTDEGLGSDCGVTGRRSSNSGDG